MEKQDQIKKWKQAGVDGAALRSQIPFVLSIIEEMSPVLGQSVAKNELIGMAGVLLGQLERGGTGLSRTELRRQIEEKLVEIYGLKAIQSNGPAQDRERDEEIHLKVCGSRILIVDDSATARRQIRYFLEKDGFQVFEAKSGEEAVWLVGETEPDLILMDVMMDGMGGFQACERIRENHGQEELPIIFLSAKGERSEIIHGFRAGAIDYIVKPFHPAESLTRIRTHLRMRKLSECRREHIVQLKQLNQTKDRILRVASHDLRNPVAAIAGLTGFLKDSLKDARKDQVEVIQCIDEAAKGVVGLLNNLLDLSAMDREVIEPEFENIQLADLVRTSLPLFRIHAENKDIEIRLETLDPGQVQVDRQHFRRILDNLLSNAIKFTPCGGKVAVYVDRQGEDVRVFVQDSGPGIPENVGDSIFEEFGNRPNKPTNGEASTGLGLSIVKRLVQANKGSIDYINLDGGGARFGVSFPHHPFAGA